MICGKNGSSESMERPIRQMLYAVFLDGKTKDLWLTKAKRWNAQKGDIRLSVARASSFFWWSFGADGAVYLGGTCHGWTPVFRGLHAVSAVLL